MPDGWLAALPGTTLVAAHAKLMPATEAPLDADTLATLFEGNIDVGGEVEWLVALNRPELLDLLALCSATTLNALPSTSAASDANALAEAVGLNMAD